MTTTITVPTALLVLLFYVAIAIPWVLVCRAVGRWAIERALREEGVTDA